MLCLCAHAQIADGISVIASDRSAHRKNERGLTVRLRKRKRAVAEVSGRCCVSDFIHRPDLRFRSREDP